MSAPSTVGAMHLADYVAILRRQWWVVVAAVVVGLALAAGYTATAQETYTVTTSVLVTPTGTEPENSSGSRGSTINMDTEAKIITSTEVLEAVGDALDHTGDLAELADRVTISVPPNTEILDVSFRGDTATDAREGATAFAAAYLLNRRLGAESSVEADRTGLRSRMEDLNTQLDTVTTAIATLPEGSAGRAYNEAQAASLNTQLGNLGAQLNKLDGVTITPGRVITQATTPTAPSSPKPLMNLTAGGLLGLVIGLSIAVGRWRGDRLLRSAGDVERLVGLNVLADLPGDLHAGRVELAGPATAAGRTYARLRNIVTASARQDARVVLVAGVSGPSGPVAANLAAALSRVGERVVLVCADVTADTELDLRGETAETGLAETLVGRSPGPDALQPVPGLEGLWVLGVGSDAQQATELLQTAAPKTLLTHLLDSVDRVVIEAPTTTSGADAQTLASLADLALVVLHAGVTTAPDSRDAVDQFESVRTPVLGAVMVRAVRSHRPNRAGNGTGTVPAAGRYRALSVAPSHVESVEQDGDAVRPEDERSPDRDHVGTTRHPGGSVGSGG